MLALLRQHPVWLAALNALGPDAMCEQMLEVSYLQMAGHGILGKLTHSDQMAIQHAPNSLSARDANEQVARRQ